jgi:hypothetical protein
MISRIQDVWPVKRQNPHPFPSCCC